MTVGPGDEVRDEEERGADVLKPDMDNRGIFRGDAGERAVDSSADKAVDAVTVGPGDEVLYGGDPDRLTWTVIGPAQVYQRENEPQRIVIQHGDLRGVHTHNPPIEALRTPDGRPVSGFREPRAELVNAKDSVLLGQRIVELEKYVVELEGRPVMQTEWEQQQARIAELEQELRGARRLREIAHEAGTKLRHERDEARAERDEAVAYRRRDEPWVRLDDETIERVTRLLLPGDYATRDMWWHVPNVLRDLRDGKPGRGHE